MRAKQPQSLLPLLSPLCNRVLQCWFLCQELWLLQKPSECSRPILDQTPIILVKAKLCRSFNTALQGPLWWHWLRAVLGACGNRAIEKNALTRSANQKCLQLLVICFTSLGPGNSLFNQIYLASCLSFWVLIGSVQCLMHGSFSQNISSSHILDVHPVRAKPMCLSSMTQMAVPPLWKIWWVVSWLIFKRGARITPQQCLQRH